MPGYVRMAILVIPCTLVFAYHAFFSSTDNLQKLDQSDSLLRPMKTYYDMCRNDSIRHNETKLRNQFYEAFESLGYTFLHNPSRNYPPIDITSVLANMMKHHL